jgi:hypothetical protein
VGVPRHDSPQPAFDSGPEKLSPNSCAYETLSALNQYVEQVLQNLERLRQLGLFETPFRRQSLKACRATIKETRAWINFEITEYLHDQEQRNWVRFGKIRRRWEEKYADPNDALIKTERLKRKLAGKKRIK